MPALPESHLSTNNTEPKSAPILEWATKELPGHYIKVIDDVFTPSECAALIALAEKDHQWIQAAINYGLGKGEHYVDTEYRNGERILRFDKEAAARLYERLLPYVEDVRELSPGHVWDGVIRSYEAESAMGTWKMACLNERLSFLRYTKGGYFQHHCDGPLELPDGRVAHITVQIYLGEDGVEGGATRLYGPGFQSHYDVEPKKGRVLIFQQSGVFHSGEEVVGGTKYAVRSDFLYRLYDKVNEL